MSATALACDGCHKHFRVISNQAGRKVRCPHCGVVNAVSPALFYAPATQAPSNVTSQPTTEDGTDTAAGISSEQAGPDPLGAVADAVRQTRRRIGHRSLPQARMRYTHSALARTADGVGKILLIAALPVEIYILFTTEWGAIAYLPMKLALPAYAVTLVPAGTIAITALFLLMAAHCTEYLARIAAASESG